MALMQRTDTGFTLVEAMIVMVVVALLAVIGVPVYFNYVGNARQAVVDDLAGTAAASANAHFRKTGAHPDSADLGLFLSDPDRFNVSVDAGERTVTVTDNQHDKTGSAGY